MRSRVPCDVGPRGVEGAPVRVVNHSGHFLSMHSRMNAAWLIAFPTAATFAGLGLSESSCTSLRTHNRVAAKRIAYFRSSVMGVPADWLRAEVGPSLYLMAELPEGSGAFEAETRKGPRGL